MGSKGMGSCLPPCGNWLMVPVPPFHPVCKAPKLVEEEFKEFAEGRDNMTVKDMTKYMRDKQGESTVTEEEVRNLMERFIDALMRSSSSRHLRQLGVSNSNRGFRSPGSSKSLKQELLAVERSGREPPTFTLPLFLKFLLNPIYNGHRSASLYPPSKTVSENMTAPLSDYYIFASHNTYLTGNQLTSKSSTEPIVNALKSGCRVIEIDCWNGPDGTIKVTHGNTLTKSVGFEDCIQAIKNNAFVASEYPVIVTIENHLSQANQKQAAQVLKRVLKKDMFIPSPSDRPPVAFLSPEALKKKIIISDKPPGDSVSTQVMEEPKFAENMVAGALLHRSSSSGSSSEDESKSLRGGKKTRRRQIQVAESILSPISDEDSSSQDEPRDPEFEELLYIHCQKPSEMVERQKKGGPLVPGQHAIMANLSESQLDDHIKSHPKDLIEFSKKNLARVYPFGLRFDSSNADPMDAWSHGIQVAAINMQGKDRAVWISRALFSKNGGCGYVKKPDILLPGSTATLNYESFKNLHSKLELKVRVLMGTDWHRNYDLFKKPDYFVKVAVHGMYDDGLKKHTKWIKRSREPHWDKEFTFQIRVPELAILRLEVKEHDTFLRDDMVGQSCVPVTGLRQGIRAVKLQSKKGEHRNSKLLCEFRLTSLSPSNSGPMSSVNREPVPGCWG
ncbi:hypothetical protein M758_4G246900 [Ceratodon purpureus]|nr:hypothetical protein M758_4G246900 [Ceratodon purpureus]